MAVAARTDLAFQQCIDPACGATFSVDEVLTSCPSCGNLLDITYDWDRLPVPTSFEVFERKWMRRSDPLAFSGVWRFHDLLPFAPREAVVTIGEGQTLLSVSDGVGGYVGMKPGRLHLQYEGLNPSGSFKDNGMSAAFSHARMIGARRAACASTGNTSASLAVYCAVTRLMRGIIFIGSGKISYGKLYDRLGLPDLVWHAPLAREGQPVYAVRDFIHFRLEGVIDWPIFNLADSFLVAGAGLLLLLAMLPTTGQRPFPAAIPGSGTATSPEGNTDA